MHFQSKDNYLPLTSNKYNVLKDYLNWCLSNLIDYMWQSL